MKLYFNKGWVLILCLLLSSNVLSFGQSKQLKRPPNPKIRALHIQAVTRNMEMDASQKDNFLPLYNEYCNQLLIVYRQKHALKDNPNSSYVVDERLKLEKEILSIKEKYKNRFLKVISSSQLESMYKGEDEFKHLLMERLKDKHNSH